MSVRRAAKARARALLLAGGVAIGAMALAAGQAGATGSLGDAAPKRYAIVIGNGDYAVAPDLRNARADATLVAEFLSGQGYAVTSYAANLPAKIDPRVRGRVTRYVSVRPSTSSAISDVA
jgi:hypothetical protein